MKHSFSCPNLKNFELIKQTENLLTIKTRDKLTSKIIVPIYKKRQILSIFLYLLIPWIFLYINFLCLRYLSIYYLSVYLILATYSFWRQDNINPHSLNTYIRNLTIWKWFKNYFPISLKQTAILDKNRNYIFGYHPHGILPFGAIINFGTNANKFDNLYPGIKPHLVTLRTQFFIPFYNIYLSFFGITDASKESINKILKNGPGSSCVIILGGAKESLNAYPESTKLTLKNRKGFVKLALLNGASLVPVYSFGQNDSYNQIIYNSDSLLRIIQKKLQQKLGFSIPFFYGTGIFFKFGFLPRRKPINTVIGKPIHCPKIEIQNLRQIIIDYYHNLYINELKKIYNKYKLIYCPHGKPLEFV